MIFEEKKGDSFQPDEVIYPVRKAPPALLDIKYLTG